MDLENRKECEAKEGEQTGMELVPEQKQAEGSQGQGGDETAMEVQTEPQQISPRKRGGEDRETWIEVRCSQTRRRAVDLVRGGK